MGVVDGHILMVMDAPGLIVVFQRWGRMISPLEFTLMFKVVSKMHLVPELWLQRGIAAIDASDNFLRGSGLWNSWLRGPLELMLLQRREEKG